MKHDDTSDVLKKIEEAIESMKKRMYEIKKENNPSLDWNSFCKNFDSMNDSNDVSLKNKLFQEEIDKIISLEMNLEHRRLLNSIKASINFETLKIKEENKINTPQVEKQEIQTDTQLKEEYSKVDYTDILKKQEDRIKNAKNITDEEKQK